VTKDIGGKDLSKNSDLKIDNTHLVRKCFYDGKIWTKNDLSLHTGLSHAAITNILHYLLATKEIEFIGEARSTGGRKSKQYIINKDYAHLGMIILKRDQFCDVFFVKICNLLGDVLFESKRESHEGCFEEIVDIVKDMLDYDALISTLTLSIPGVCRNGEIDICDFEKLVHCHFVGDLKKRFLLDIHIENDVNVACMGLSHYYPDVMHLALMYQPQVKYVGCGLMIQHQLYTGFSQFAGELSYLPFLSFPEQEDMLKQNPQQLLLYQVVSLCAVMNPQVIGVCSDVIESFDVSLLDRYLTKEHQPHIVFIDQLDEYIKDGLFDLGKRMILNRKGEIENGKIY